MRSMRHFHCSKALYVAKSAHLQLVSALRTLHHLPLVGLDSEWVLSNIEAIHGDTHAALLSNTLFRAGWS